MSKSLLRNVRRPSATRISDPIRARVARRPSAVAAAAVQESAEDLTRRAQRLGHRIDPRTAKARQSPSREPQLGDGSETLIRQALGHGRPRPLEPSIRRQVNRAGQKLLDHELTHTVQQGSTKSAGGIGHVSGCTDPDAIQRRIGLELELPVPVDKLGTEDSLRKTGDLDIIKGRQPNPKRLAELRKEVNDVKYARNVHSGKGFRVAIDHSSLVLDPAGTWPPRVLGKTILELVMDPPAETVGELTEAIIKCRRFVHEINNNTAGLTRRVHFVDGYYYGPWNSEGNTPPQLGFDAMVQVNIGVDVRQAANFLDWFHGSRYRPPTKEYEADGENKVEDKGKHLQMAAGLGRGLANRVRAKASKKEIEEAQNFNGYEGLATLLALYLYAGADTRPGGGTKKNFTPLLLKTSFFQIKNACMTPEERKRWNINIAETKQFLLDMTRPGPGMNLPKDENGEFRKVNDEFITVIDDDVLRVKENDLLIQNPTRTGKVRDTKSIKDLFDSVENEVKSFIVASFIGTDKVGPKRSKENVPHGKKSFFSRKGRRLGAVFETRMLPGTYKPSSWFAVGFDFLKKASELSKRTD